MLKTRNSCVMTRLQGKPPTMMKCGTLVAEFCLLPVVIDFRLIFKKAVLGYDLLENLETT